MWMKKEAVFCVQCFFLCLQFLCVWSFVKKKKKKPTQLCASMLNVDTRGTHDATATTILAGWSLWGTCNARQATLLLRCAHFPLLSPHSSTLRSYPAAAALLTLLDPTHTHSSRVSAVTRSRFQPRHFSLLPSVWTPCTPFFPPFRFLWIWRKLNVEWYQC